MKSAFSCFHQDQLISDIYDTIIKRIKLQIPQIINTYLRNLDCGIDTRNEDTSKVLNRLESENELQRLKILKLQNEIDQYKEFHLGYTEKFQMLTQTVENADLEVENLTKMTADLKERVFDLEDEYDNMVSKLDENERKEKLYNLEFHGVPYQIDEDTDQHIINVATSLGVQLQSSDISTAYRLSSTIGAIDPIVVKFTTRKIREQIIRNRHKLKLFNGIYNHPDIFIRENLTDENKEMINKIGISRN
ncbi:uncharacterized protein LOC144422982 [Styela clava]